MRHPVAAAVAAAFALALGLSVGACEAFDAATDGPDGSGSRIGEGGSNDSAASEGGARLGACVSICPVAYWAFDEEDDKASVLDGSGNGNDGVLGAVKRGPGAIGRALDFADQPGTVVVPNRPLLDTLEGTQLSITLWVWLAEPGTAGADQVILQRSWSDVFEPPYSQFALEWDYNESKDVQFLVGDSSAGLLRAASLSVPSGRWAHLAFVYDGTEVRAFFDGTLTTTMAFTTAIAKRASDIRLGSDVASQQRFGGKLDDVRIFKGVLTAADITLLAHR